LEWQRSWLDRMAIRGWSLFRFRYAVLGCIGLTAVGLAVWQARYSVSPPPGRTIATATISAPARREVQIPQYESALPATHVRAARRSRPKQDKPHEDVMVKILTDDPNIVIYWLIDGDSGGS